MATMRMKKTTPGSPDGFGTVMYEEGREYRVDVDIPASLAKAFVVDMEVAEYVTEGKAVPAAPKNAAVKAAPENKVEAPETVEKPEEKEHGWEPPKKKDKKGKVMRVYQLADELDIPSKDILIAIENLGIYARNAASGLSEEEVAKLKSALTK